MIGFIGLSHLGINSSVAVASKGFATLGHDGDASLCSQLNEGQFPIFEPGLKELFELSRKNIEFTSRPDSLAKCKLVYFSFDVPTNSKNESDISTVREMIEQSISHLLPGTVFVILSQVPPGFCRSLLPLTEANGITLCYQVETLVFGSAVQRATKPERYIVGLQYPQKPLPAIFHELLKAFDCPILPMRFESAELAKISINFYLTSTVTVTNVLAEVCENVGAVWSEIAPALRLDQRIGFYAYLSPGLGLAGGNLERDLVTVQKISSDYGTESTIVDSWLKNSEYRRDWMLRVLRQQVLNKLGPAARIGLWGLAYKVGTGSLKNAPSVSFLQSLRSLDVKVYSPEAQLPADLKTALCRQVTSPQEAAEGVDTLLIFTPSPEFKSVSPQKLSEWMQGRLILDPFAILPQAEFKETDFEILSLGVPL